MQVRIRNVNGLHLNNHNVTRAGGQLRLRHAHSPFFILRNHEENTSHMAESLFWEAPYVRHLEW